MPDVLDRLRVALAKAYRRADEYDVRTIEEAIVEIIRLRHPYSLTPVQSSFAFLEE